jgi:nucleotide-binding universal stress UspA family protein
MYRSVVVPLDGTLFGEQALPFALSIARRAGAQLHLMHAHIAEKPNVTSHAREQRYLNDLIHRLKATWDGPIEGDLIDEPVATALCDYAAAVGADLIVMSTHARSGLLRLWMGCVADEIVRSVSLPVLLIHPGQEAPDSTAEPTVKRILVTLDGSALAERILPHAVELGRVMQAEYMLLQVIESPPIESVGLEAQGPEGLRVRAQVYLERMARQAEELRVRTHVVVADRAADTILEYARDHDIGLIAMATHGRSGLGRMFMGSVADKVVRGAQAPVLLHCPGGEE